MARSANRQTWSKFLDRVATDPDSTRMLRDFALQLFGGQGIARGLSATLDAHAKTLDKRRQAQMADEAMALERQDRERQERALGETIRSNQAREGIDQQRVDLEGQRVDIAREQVDVSRLGVQAQERATNALNRFRELQLAQTRDLADADRKVRERQIGVTETYYKNLIQNARTEQEFNYIQDAHEAAIEAATTLQGFDAVAYASMMDRAYATAPPSVRKLMEQGMPQPNPDPDPRPGNPQPRATTQPVGDAPAPERVQPDTGRLPTEDETAHNTAVRRAQEQRRTEAQRRQEQRRREGTLPEQVATRKVEEAQQIIRDSEALQAGSGFVGVGSSVESIREMQKRLRELAPDLSPRDRARAARALERLKQAELDMANRRNF